MAVEKARLKILMLRFSNNLKMFSLRSLSLKMSQGRFPSGEFDLRSPHIPPQSLTAKAAGLSF